MSAPPISSPCTNTCGIVGQPVVDEPMLVEQRQPVEARARNGHLEMVASARSVLDTEIGRVGERVLEQGLQGVGRHRSHASRAEKLSVEEYAGSMRKLYG